MAAVCLLAFFLGLTTAIATVQPVRAKVLELIVNIEQEYTEIRLRDNTKVPQNVPPEWKGEYYLTAVPEGFSVARLQNLSGASMVDYENKEHTESILFIEATTQTTTRLDTEGERTETIWIHGASALVILKGGATTVTWSEDNKYFMLRYSGSKAETIAMAEEVTKIK